MKLRSIVLLCLTIATTVVSLNFLFVWMLDYIRGDVTWRLNVEKCSFVCMLRHGDDTIGRYVDFPRQSCTCTVEVSGFQHIKE